MKSANIRKLILLVPFVFGCSDHTAPLAPEASTISVRASITTPTAPVTAEGYLPGAGGVQLHYRIVGSGPDSVVVLTGGPGLPMSYMAKDLDALAHGRTLIFFDPRGTGHSTLLFDPAQLGIQQHVDDLEALRQHFGIGKLAILGHSWGAMVAPWYAAQHPERVERMVLLTPGPIRAAFDAETEANRVARTDPAVLQQLNGLLGLLASGQSPDPVATCEQLFSTWFATYFADPSNIANQKGRFCDGPPLAANVLLLTLTAGRGSLGPDWDLAPMLAGIQAPALVIHGAADIIPQASSAAYAAALPKGEFRVIQGAGHFPWLEQPVEFFTTVNAFLRRGDVVN